MPTHSERTEVAIAQGDPRDNEAAALLEALSQTLSAITGSSGTASFDPADVAVPRSLFLIARDRTGQAVGCGSYRPHSETEAEIKRMLALPGTRGVGAALLAALERAARDDGYSTAICETRRANARAVAFYLGQGYAVVPNFGRYRGRPEAICFAKGLVRRR